MCPFNLLDGNPKYNSDCRLWNRCALWDAIFPVICDSWVISYQAATWPLLLLAALYWLATVFLVRYDGSFWLPAHHEIVISHSKLHHKRFADGNRKLTVNVPLWTKTEVESYHQGCEAIEWTGIVNSVKILFWCHFLGCVWSQRLDASVDCHISGGQNTQQQLCSIVSRPGRSSSHSSSQYITESNGTM